MDATIKNKIQFHGPLISKLKYFAQIYITTEQRTHNSFWHVFLHLLFSVSYSFSQEEEVSSSQAYSKFLNSKIKSLSGQWHLIGLTLMIWKFVRLLLILVSGAIQKQWPIYFYIVVQLIAFGINCSVCLMNIGCSPTLWSSFLWISNSNVHLVGV